LSFILQRVIRAVLSVFNVWKLNANHKRFLIIRCKVEIGSFLDIFSDRAAICAFRGILLANNIVIAPH